MDNLTKMAIDMVFEIIEDRERVKKMDDLQKRLGFKNMDFSFGAFLDANEDRLVKFLDWFFYPITGMHPDNNVVGGLVSYTLYDAATPYLHGKPYNLKDKTDFLTYINDCIENRKSVGASHEKP